MRKDQDEITLREAAELVQTNRAPRRVAVDAQRHVDLTLGETWDALCALGAANAKA